MTLDKARELLAVQAVDELIRELQLDRIFDFKPGTRFDGGLAT